jgi:hypothetical protein
MRLPYRVIKLVNTAGVFNHQNSVEFNAPDGGQGTARPTRSRHRFSLAFVRISPVIGLKRENERA